MVLLAAVAFMLTDWPAPGTVAAIIAEHAFEYLDGPVARLAMWDTHNAFSPSLEEAILPNTNKIVEAIKRLASY